MTTTLTPNSLVGDFVVERPARSRVFERLGIDYCCGGRQSLATACRGKGLDPQEVIEALDRGAEPTHGEDPAAMTLTQLADHIERTHHAWLRGELSRLHALIEKVAQAHSDGYAWLRQLSAVFETLQAELESHTLKEERVLFPLIRQIEAGVPIPSVMMIGIEQPVHCMETEHASAGRALETMRRLSSDYTPPPEACNTFRAMLDGLAELEADMHLHVHKENNILFPRAVALGRRRAAEGV